MRSIYLGQSLRTGNYVRSSGFDFTNFLQAAFTSVDPKSVERHLWLDCLFELLGPGLNFINVLRTAFMLEDPKSVKRYRRLDWVLTLWGATGVKAVHKYVDEIDPCLLKSWEQTFWWNQPLFSYPFVCLFLSSVIYFCFLYLYVYLFVRSYVCCPFFFLSNRSYVWCVVHISLFIHSYVFCPYLFLSFTLSVFMSSWLFLSVHLYVCLSISIQSMRKSFCS